MFGLQPTHLILILVVALIIFGPKQLLIQGKEAKTRPTKNNAIPLS